MAWLNGWTYRKAITITEQSGSDLTNFQKRIDLDNTNFDFTKANSDGSDIRITTDDGTTLLDIWKEEWDTTNQIGKVWVKIPSLLANSSITLYLYYGNPNAVDADNPEGVFDFYDDFNGPDLDLNKWTPDYVGTVYYEIVDSNLRILDGYKQSNEFWIYDNTDSGSQIKANVDLTDKYIVEWTQKMETQTSVSQMGEVGLGLAKADKAFEVYNTQYDDNAHYIRYEVGVSSFIGGSRPSRISITADTYYLMSIIKAGTSYTLKAQGLDGSNVFTYTGTSTSPVDYLAVGVGAYEPYALSKMQIDLVRVRKYADIEPSAVFGVEETSGGVVYSESLLDTVSLSESSKSMLSIINADSINAVSLEKQNPNGLQVDVINTIDVQKASPTNFNRSLAYLTELELGNTTKVISDVATTLAYLKSSPTVPNSDIAVLSEVLTQVAIKVQSLSDAAGAVDLTTINALNRALEAISFLESLSPAVRFNISEFVATVDTLTDKLTTLIKEGATISELLTESTAGGVQIETILDGLTVGDSLISDLLVIHVAKLLLTDSLRGYPSSSLIDSINSLERTTTALSFKLIDSVNAGESTKFIPTMILKEIIPTLDSLISRSATVFIAIEDSIRALDNNKAMVTGRLIDTLTPAEALQVIAYQLAAAIVRLLSKIALLAALESITTVLKQNKSIINQKVDLESRIRKLGG